MNETFLRISPFSGEVKLNEIISFMSKILANKIGHKNEIIRFERDFATYLGLDGAISVNMGRTAIIIALRSLNLKPGSEIIVPAYTCAIVYEPIMRLNLKPVLIDVNPKTFNINPDLIPEAISEKTKAIIPIHLFGRPCEIDSVMEIARDNDLFVIEDVAQAMGAKYNGARTGTFGDLSIFSLGPGKCLFAGEGGIIGVNNKELLPRVERERSNLPFPDTSWLMRVLRNIYGMYFSSNPYFYDLVKNMVEKTRTTDNKMISENCLNLIQNKPYLLNPTIKPMQMPTISAIFGSLKLRMLESVNNSRISNSLILKKLINPIKRWELPVVNSNERNIFMKFVVKVEEEKRDRIAAELVKLGMEVSKPYDYVLEILRLLGKFPVAETLCKTLLTLPNYPNLSPQEIYRIGKIIREVADQV